MLDKEILPSSANISHEYKGQNRTLSGRKLGSICDLVNGFAFEPSDWRKDGVPIIRIQNLNGGGDFNFFRGTIPHRYNVDTGDLLFSWSGNRGTSFGPFIWGGPAGYLNQHIFKVLPRTDVNQRWLYHALHDVRQRAEKNAHGGSGLVHVKRSDLIRYNVLTPEEDEQRAIADVLDAVDAAIRETNALIAKLKVLRLGLIGDLLTRGIDDNGELRREEELVATPIGKRPKNWQVAPLGLWLSGIDQGWSPDCSDEVTPVGEWGVLKTASVVWEGYQDSENKRLPSTLLPQEELVVREGDVLMTRAGPGHRVAVVAYVDRTQGRLMLSDKLYRIRPAASLEPQYLALSLYDRSAQRQLNAEKSGMAESQVNISQQGLRRILFPHPGSHEQQVIAHVVRALDQRITIDRSGAEKLFKLREGLRDDLLAGRVRVAVAAEAAT